MSLFTSIHAIPSSSNSLSAWWYLIHPLPVSLEVSFPRDKVCTDPIEVTTASVLSSTFHTTMKFFTWACVSLAMTTVSFLSAKIAPYPCPFLNVFMPNFDFFLSLYPSENKNRNIKHTCKLICVWNSTLDSRGLITYLC